VTVHGPNSQRAKQILFPRYVTCSDGGPRYENETINGLNETPKQDTTQERFVLNGRLNLKKETQEQVSIASDGPLCKNNISRIFLHLKEFFKIKILFYYYFLSIHIQNQITHNHCCMIQFLYTRNTH
jgi:hypothetical protein